MAKLSVAVSLWCNMKLPVYNLTRVEVLRSRLFEELQLDFVGTKPIGADFDAFVDAVHRILPGGIDRLIVYDSLLYILGQELTKTVLLQLSWLLAGNVKVLKEGKLVRPWRVQGALEWVPLEVVDHEYVADYGKKRKSGYLYTFKVLAGSPAGVCTVAFWSKQYIYFLRGTLGFSGWRHKEGKPRLSFHDPVEFMGLRFYALLDPVFNFEGMPGFRTISVPHSCIQHNRVILQARARVDFVCPKNYTHECFVCPIGADQCPASCHPRTYVTQVCDTCSKASSFDPQRGGRICLNCIKKARDKRTVQKATKL